MRVFKVAVCFLTAVGCAQPLTVGLDLGVEDAAHDGGFVMHDLAGRDFASSTACDMGAGLRGCAGECIPATNCCTGSDCPTPPTGSAMCQAGMCVNSCNAGYHSCGTNCIPNNACCVDGDCMITSNVQATTCNSTNGTCHVKSCANGYYDVDGQYQNGCECKDLGVARTCQTATPLGSMTIGGSLSPTGNLPVVGEENWFSVTFTGNTQPGYHPKVALSSNPNGAFVLDVVADCNGAQLGCQMESGKTANGVQTWEVQTTGGDFTPPAGQSAPVQTFSATPAVGSGGKVFIRVYHASTGTPTCSAYTLTVSN